MKILQINIVYKKGSTGRIVYDIHQYLLNKDEKSIVCYGRGKNQKEQYVYKAAPEIIMKMQSFRSRITGYIYSGCIISTNNIIKIIKKEKPDVVHLHCINGYIVNIYKLLNFLKTNKINTVLTLHAEFMFTAGCSYSYDCNQWITGCCAETNVCPQFNKLRPKSWFFNRCKNEWEMMYNSFKDFSNLIICPVSDWLKYRAIESPFMSDKNVITVTNGIDTSVFKYNNDNNLKEKHNLKDEKIILHVTSNFLAEIKGGKYVLELAKRLLNKNYKIIIIGYNGDGNNLTDNIIVISHINDIKQLSYYYSIANVSLITSKKETFSMICAESLCCGTPVVGFLSGAPETISIKEYSEFVEYGNIDELEHIVTKWCDYNNTPKELISETAINVYSKELMNKKYYDLYKGNF